MSSILSNGKRWMLVLVILLTLTQYAVYAAYADSELWVATAYCSCKKCCGKTDGITASGIKAHKGTVACNWLPFGTKMTVRALGGDYSRFDKPYDCIVEDRGAKSIFGSKNKHIKRLDIWFPTHIQALIFGRRVVEVNIQQEV